MKQYLKFQWPMIYVLIILLGVGAGYYDWPILKPLGMLTASIFVKAFKFISLPIITLSIIVTLAQYRSDGSMKLVWRRTMSYTLLTTLIAASVSALLYLLIHPSKVGNASGAKQELIQNSQTYLDYLVQLLPNNFLEPFIHQQVISALLLGVITGLGIRCIPESESQHFMIQMFRALHGLLMVLTGWIIRVIPLALFGFITTTVIQLKSGMQLQGIGEYLLIVVLANLIQGFIVLPLWLRWHGLAPFKAMKGMMPALSVAFFSKSSVGTLPVTMKTIENYWSVRPEISRFVLPLCTSLNMNGCAAFIFATVVYLMQNHGIELSYATMALWVLIATIAAIGNAGVPMGCFFLSTSLLASMNVPITLMGIILPFYSLIDMLETALNVWSDSCVAKIVNEGYQKKLGQ
jgi:Na+/H+-dicarboxylate symporter